MDTVADCAAIKKKKKKYNLDLKILVEKKVPDYLHSK